MSRNVSESVKKRIAGRQEYKCANSPNKTLKGIEGFTCPLWDMRGGSFNESGYEIDHIIEHSISHNDDEKNLQALCLMCHSTKSKRFASSKAKNKTPDPPKVTKPKKKYCIEIDTDSDSDFSSESDKNNIESEPESESEETTPIEKPNNEPKVSFDSDSESESVLSDTEPNYIGLSVDQSVWKLANALVTDPSIEKIICGYNEKNHSYLIYRFNKTTTLYELIDAQKFINTIRKHVASDKNVRDIAIEVCRLTFMINLREMLDSDTSENYLNGYCVNNKLLKRTPLNYVTKCKNDFFCANVSDYIETFYKSTKSKEDKIDKEEFIDLYCIHSTLDINRNSVLKNATEYGLKYSSKGYFIGLKKIIFSCDLDIYQQFYKKHIKKTNSIADIINRQTLVSKFIKWYDMEIMDKLKPADREIVYCFSMHVFGLSSRRGEEFPLTKFKIVGI